MPKAQPEDLQRDIHNLIHTSVVAWCQACKQKAKGTLHRRVDQLGQGEEDFALEADYTFWSDKGFQTKTDDDSGAVKSITIVTRKTGMPCSTIVEKKGNIPYVVQLGVQFVMRLRLSEYNLRGDKEFSQQCLLRNSSKSEGPRDPGKRSEAESSRRASEYRWSRRTACVDWRLCKSLRGSNKRKDRIGNLGKRFFVSVDHPICHRHCWALACPG
jgi:hypothetical protein